MAFEIARRHLYNTDYMLSHHSLMLATSDRKKNSYRLMFVVEAMFFNILFDFLHDLHFALLKLDIKVIFISKNPYFLGLNFIEPIPTLKSLSLFYSFLQHIGFSALRFSGSSLKSIIFLPSDCCV